MVTVGASGATGGSGSDAFPVRATRFIGRTQAIADLRSILRERRLVTVAGTGGCGKTRLAVEVARLVEPAYADRGAFVDLASVEPSLVANAFAAAAGVPEEGNRPVRELLWAALADRHALVVVDNCEGVIDEAAAVIDGILSGCPRITLLATSREPLGVEGEVTWRVPSLTLPEPGTADPLAALRASEAGALLLDRAELSRPDLAWSCDRAAAAVTMCRRLDGVPLALELAASRLRSLEPGEVARGLDDRFAILRSGLRTAPPRQRTLEASIDWSHELTPEPARMLLRRLAVFAGAFSLDDAAAVVATGTLCARDVPALLADLVDRSLVQAAPRGLTGGEAADRSSYRLLETLRAYAALRLDEAGESEQLHHRHLAHFAEVARRFDAVAETDQLDTARHTIAEALGDLRAAMAWGLANGHADASLAIAAGVRLFWITESRNQEGRDWLATLLDCDELTPPTRLAAVLAAAQLALFAIDPLRQATLAAEGLELARELGDRRSEARALTLLGWSRVFFEPARAVALLNEAIDLAEQIDDRIRIEFASFGAGAAALGCGDLAAAAEHAERGVALSCSRDTFGQMFGLGLLGYVRCLQGDLDTALEHLRLACAFDGGDETGFNRDLAEQWLAYVLTLQARYDEAAAQLDTTLARAQAAGNPTMFVRVSAAWLAAARGDDAAVAEHTADALPLLELIGVALWQVQAHRLAGDAAAARGADGTAHWQQAMAVAEASSNPIARTIALLGLARSPDNDAARTRRLLRDAVRAALGAGYRIGLIDALEALVTNAADELDRDDAAGVLAAAATERERIGYRAFAPAAQAASGRVAPSLEEAATVACRGDRRPARPPDGWASLTPAELRVARLVADGLTNPQIGERLFLSRRTVQTHLSHAFTKLRLSSRAELASAFTREQSPN